MKSKKTILRVFAAGNRSGFHEGYLVGEAKKVNDFFSNNNVDPIKITIDKGSFPKSDTISCPDERVLLEIKERDCEKLKIPQITLAFKDCHFPRNPFDYVKVCAGMIFEGCQFKDFSAEGECSVLEIKNCSFLERKELRFTNNSKIHTLLVDGFENLEKISLEQQNYNSSSEPSIILKNLNVDSLLLKEVRNIFSIIISDIQLRSPESFFLEDIKGTALKIETISDPHGGIQTVMLEKIVFLALTVSSVNILKIGHSCPNNQSEVHRLDIDNVKTVRLSHLKFGEFAMKNTEDVYLEKVTTTEKERTSSIMNCEKFKAIECIFYDLLLSGISNDETNPGNYSMSRLSFQNNTFNKNIDLLDLSIPKNISLLGNKFKYFGRGSTIYYRDLKQKFLSIGNNNHASHFQGLEMKAIFMNAKLFSEDKILGFFSWVFNDFGMSLFRPLGILLISLAVFMFLYSLWGSPFVISLKGAEGWPTEIKDWNICGKSLLFSIYNTLGPFGFFLNKYLLPSNLFVEIFSFTQKVVSSVLIYLFIVGLKKRFRQL